MYLKSLEISGFKSFPIKTRLEFGKGMTAIVGPNGCGKSNISDAIRWVLGEQSAKLLRGTKMEDCIFTGTDTRKPLGMAEVSLTFADCENTIETEFNELTVTRRVFRSGEGQYFINKTPCRLRDIQRLFMDTGVGTNSYSLMEQGRVDLILSSRPEDRRAVFEEASGITRYKSDKREALRKLEQTEANLVRLADIIKEVKRQIISLQRQAGKARRAQSLRQELKSLDIFVSRQRINAMDAEIENLQTQAASNGEALESFQLSIRQLETRSEDLRNELAGAERGISAASQVDGELRSKLHLAVQSMESGHARIEELRDLLKRDSDDAEKASAELEKQRKLFDSTTSAVAEADATLAFSEKTLAHASEKLASHELACEKNRQTIENLHSDLLDLESQAAKLQNRLHDMDVEDRNIAATRERKAAEQANLSRVLKGFEKRLDDFTSILEELKKAVSSAQASLSSALSDRASLSDSVRGLEQRRSELMLRISSAQAQMDIIGANMTAKGALPAGNVQMLDDANPMGIDRSRLMGAFFEQIETTPEFRPALEAALRLVLDSIVVTNIQDGLELLRSVESSVSGPVRLLAVDVTSEDAADAAPDEIGIALIDKVSCPDRLRPLVQRLLGGIRVVHSLEDVPSSLCGRCAYVTTAGAVVRGNGTMELYRSGAETGNPLALKHQMLALEESLRQDRSLVAKIDDQLLGLRAKSDDLEKAIANCRATLAERQNALARKDGEHLSLLSQSDRARENLETVTYEIRELEQQGCFDEERSKVISEIERVRTKAAEVKDTIGKRRTELLSMDQKRRQLAAEQTEAHVQLARHREAAAHLKAQSAPLAERIAGLEQLIRDRTSRASAYRSEMGKLAKTIADAAAQVPLLREEIAKNQGSLSEVRERSANINKEWQAALDELKSTRASMDELRDKQNEINGLLIEQRMRRTAAIERISSDYRIPADSIALESPPQWPAGQPDIETLDNTIAELRAKIEAMGPVYEGAIDEYRQLEERFAFLQNQQNDLIKSKQQLMDMIKKINQTTTEMFANTFAVINENFQSVFKRLFGGGSAKLMLADEDDVLESGIEIIARPPGKRLQSVSLLSGGERALTAVALLFSIYLFKPSPFCVLDELDAPLDEANIGRFIKMLQDFLEKSQFIVITHNRQTISAADVLYGITMEEFGVSKVVSMKFTEQRAQAAAQPAGAAS